MYSVLFAGGDYNSSLKHLEFSTRGSTISKAFETMAHCLLMASFAASIAPFFTLFSFAFVFLRLSVQGTLVATCNSYKRFFTMGPIVHR